MSKKTSEKAGKIGVSHLRKLINKKAGFEVAPDLSCGSPTEVTEWIPTGSRWLDSIICKGQLAGIPVGKITEIAGLTSTGKSYIAAQVAANAQKMNKTVVYFDSESAISPEFWERTGIRVEDTLYIQATSVEFVLEQIEYLLAEAPDEKFLFIWDSLAFTPSRSDLEGDYNPQSSMAVKPRILAKGMPKLTIPLANAGATLLVLNQLKTNITSNISEAMTTPYMTPGGKALPYSYSLRIWLTGSKAKKSKILDEKGFQIGSQVKVNLEKSRFGTHNRKCDFKILWGNEIGVQDEESWLDAIKSSERLKQGGAWYTLVCDDGTEEKFQQANWIAKLQEEKFRNNILQIMDEEVIQKFHDRTGNAEDFYGTEEESS